MISAIWLHSVLKFFLCHNAHWHCSNTAAYHSYSGCCVTAALWRFLSLSPLFKVSQVWHWQLPILLLCHLTRIKRSKPKKPQNTVPLQFQATNIYITDGDESRGKVAILIPRQCHGIVLQQVNRINIASFMPITVMLFLFYFFQALPLLWTAGQLSHSALPDLGSWLFPRRFVSYFLTYFSKYCQNFI